MGMTRTEAMAALLAHMEGKGPEVRVKLDDEYFKVRCHPELGPQWLDCNLWCLDSLTEGEYSLVPPAPRTFLGVWEEVPSFAQAEPAGEREVRVMNLVMMKPMALRSNGKQLDYALEEELILKDGPWFWVRRIPVNPPTLSELKVSRPGYNVLVENLDEPLYKDFDASKHTVAEPPIACSLIKDGLEDKKLFIARVAPGYEQCVKRFALTQGNFFYGLSGWASSDKWDLGWFKEGTLTGKRYIWLRKKAAE